MTRIHTLTILEFGDDGKFLTVADHFYETEHVPMRADRGAVKAASNQGKQADAAATGYNAQASNISSSLIPGLVSDFTHPTGLTPTQRNQALVSGGEAAGGVNAGVTGEANLASARTRSAGGFTPALAEAARQKMRTSATNVQNVNAEDVALANQRRQQAAQQLQGLYGTDTSNALRAMGLQGQDLQNQLAAGRQGWLQNTEGGLDTLSKMG